MFIYLIIVRISEVSNKGLLLKYNIENMYYLMSPAGVVVVPFKGECGLEVIIWWCVDEAIFDAGVIFDMNQCGFCIGAKKRPIKLKIGLWEIYDYLH